MDRDDQGSRHRARVRLRRAHDPAFGEGEALGAQTRVETDRRASAPPGWSCFQRIRPGSRPALAGRVSVKACPRDGDPVDIGRGSRPRPDAGDALVAVDPPILAFASTRNIPEVMPPFVGGGSSSAAASSRHAQLGRMLLRGHTAQHLRRICSIARCAPRAP
jgi:hypothetical protein